MHEFYKFVWRASGSEQIVLLLAGVIVGPYVLGFFSTNRPIADFSAELGKPLLMFFAGPDRNRLVL